MGAYYNQYKSIKAAAVLVDLWVSERVYEVCGKIIFKRNLADFLYFESGRVEEALLYWRNIRKILKPFLITGNICIALKKFDDVENFFRALEIEPANQDAVENLEALHNFMANAPAVEFLKKIFNVLDLQL